LKAEAVLDRFRIPYFDAFLPRQLQKDGSYVYGVPIIFTLPQILVQRSAGGKWEPAANPLYSFKFSQAAQKEIDFSWYGKLKSPKAGTVRGLDTVRDRPNHRFVVDALDNVYNPNNGVGTSAPFDIWQVMMRSNQNWVRMSNHYSPTNRTEYNENNLEGFHDNIHTQLGVGEVAASANTPAGHMSNPDYAG